jgi:hypothetical protein
VRFYITSNSACTRRDLLKFFPFTDMDDITYPTFSQYVGGNVNVTMPAPKVDAGALSQFSPRANLFHS